MCRAVWLYSIVTDYSNSEDHMRTKSKLILAGLAASLLMATAVGSASARVFSLSNRNYRIVWTSLEFIEPSMRFATVRCPVTFEGSFHSSTFSKVENALIGHVSRATVAGASCTGGRATIHQESLPWHATYRGFRGLLPRISSIRISLKGPRISIFEPTFTLTCIGTATTEHPAVGEALVEENAGGREIVNFSFDESLIPVNGCIANNVKFSAPAGDGRVTLLGNTTRIRVTLI